MSKLYCKGAQHQAPCNILLGSSKELGTLELRTAWDQAPHRPGCMLNGANGGIVILTDNYSHRALVRKVPKVSKTTEPLLTCLT